MKGYDTLNETAPTAPPPYSPYQQQAYNMNQTSPVYQMQPSRPPPMHTSVQVNPPMGFPATSVVVQPHSKECCCCCCSCPFWVCCLVIGLIIVVSLLSSLPFIKQ